MAAEGEVAVEENEPVPAPEFPSGLFARLTVAQDCVRVITSVFQFVREFDDLLRVSPFAFHSFINELHLRRPHSEGFEKGECLPLAILGEIHIGMLRYLLAQEAGTEDFLATVMLDRFTWPEILKQYLFFHNHLLEFDDTIDEEDGGTKLLKEVIEGFAFGVSGDYFILSVRARLFILDSLCDRLLLTTAFLRRINWRLESTGNESECVRCGEEDLLIGCAVCPSSYHLKCCEPPLRRHPNEIWTCPPCLERKKYPIWFVREATSIRPSPFPVLHEPTQNAQVGSETEQIGQKLNAPRQFLGADCGGRSYSACSGFIFVSQMSPDGRESVECIVGFPHLLCPLIAFLDKHCEQDRAISQALLSRFEVFEKLLELQFAPSTTKLKGLLIGIPLPRAEAVQELAQSIGQLSGLSMPEVTGRLVNVINTINLINNSAFAKKEGTQDSVVFAPDVYVRDFQPRAAHHLMSMNLDQNHIGLFCYVNRYPPPKIFAHKALANAQDITWSATDALSGLASRTLAQVFETLSYVTNMRNRLVKIHERLPRRVLKSWWCIGKQAHEWTARARACTSFHEIRVLMLELESAVMHELITLPPWLSGEPPERADANQIVEVIVGGMGQTAEQATKEWTLEGEVKVEPTAEGEEGVAPPPKPARVLVVQEVWQRAVHAARTFSRLALLLRVFDSCIKWDVLQRPRGKQSHAILEAVPPLVIPDTGVISYDSRALEQALQKRLNAPTPPPAFGQFESHVNHPVSESKSFVPQPTPEAPLDLAHLQELRSKQMFVVLTHARPDDDQQEANSFQPSYPPAQHLIEEDKVPALWLFAEYEARLRASSIAQRNERIVAEQARIREQERLIMEAQRMQAQERMLQEAQRERAKIAEIRNYNRMLEQQKEKEEEDLRRRLREQQVQREGVEEPKKTKKAKRDLLEQGAEGDPKSKEAKLKKPRKEKTSKPPPVAPEPVEPADGLYCLCRTPYNDQQFYVGCDLCGGWYHGTCVGVSPAYASKIKRYKCPKCRPEKKSKIAKHKGPKTVE